MKASILAFACCLTALYATDPSAVTGEASSTVRDALPSTWTTVTIPYVELRTLWATAYAQARQIEQLKRAQPPVASLLLSSEYELRLGPNAPVIHAVYRVRTLTDDWHLVPLLGGEVRLGRTELAPAGASILWDKDQYSLLTKGIGDYDLTLTFVPATAADLKTLRGLRLRPARSTLSQIRVVGTHNDMILRIPDLAPRTEGEGIQTYDLPAEGSELLLAFEPELPPEAHRPNIWSLFSEVLVACRDARLIYRVRVQARADSGSGTSLDLLLPQNVEVAQVNGDDLSDWRLGSTEAGRRSLHLAWKTRDRLSRTFEVDYEVAQSPLVPQWVLQAPRAAGAAANHTRFVVLPVDGLELRGDISRTERPSWRLPEWMRLQIGDGDYFTAEGGPELELAAIWLPRVQTAQAMVNRANFQSRIVEDGAVLINAEWTLQHETSLNWRLRLPAVDQLLTCQVNGQKSQPIRRDDQILEIALAASEQRTSRVELAYAVRLSALDPVSGSLMLQLPQTDLFVHELNWLLHLPEPYETTALEGNVSMAAVSRVGPEAHAGARNLLQLKKELVQGETPKVEIHYQRRGLADDNPVP